MSQYYAVILEFSSQAVRLGFAHEPRELVCVCPDNPEWRKYAAPQRLPAPPAFLGLTSPCVDPKLRAELTASFANDASYLRLLRSHQNDSTQWHDWAADGYTGLARMVRRLLSTVLLISPSKSKLFVVDQGMLAAAKRAFCEAVLAQQSACVVFFSYSLCVAVASGVRDALVVHFGWERCKVAVVVDLRVVQTRQYVEFSHETVHYTYSMSSFDAEGGCENATGSSCGATEGTYHAVERRLQHDLSGDFDLATIALQKLPSVLADTIRRSSIDNRPLLARNIIMTGPLSQFGRLQEVVLQETSKQLYPMCVKGMETIGAWAGASLYCSTVLFKEEYDNWKHTQIGAGQLDARGDELECLHG